MTDVSHNPDNPSAPHLVESGPITQDNTIQPDPEVRLSEGRATATQITITTIAALVILFVVMYGLNQRPETVQSPTTTASETTNAGGQASAPAPAADQKAPASNPQDANTGSSGNGKK
ncbi:MAG: hypothetical protein J0H17_12250 [Rhizobiales bacterium]|nr:hypothetical protein [Hyphomicrobiales bacterium]